MFKKVFTVVDSYEQQNFLVLVADISENSLASSDYRNGETVEFRLPDGSSFSAPSTEVLFDPPVDRPFCLAFKGLRKNDIPLGTQVWINEERPVRKPSRHYEQTKRPDERRRTA
jgi:hypothetical protein